MWGGSCVDDGRSVVAVLVVGPFRTDATLFFFFQSFLGEKEAKHAVTRGQPGSEITAMCYGEYFPSPGPLGSTPSNYSREAHEALNSLISEPVAFVAEVVGTLFLALVVFAVPDARNLAAPTV